MHAHIHTNDLFRRWTSECRRNQELSATSLALPVVVVVVVVEVVVEVEVEVVVVMVVVVVVVVVVKGLLTSHAPLDS